MRRGRRMVIVLALAVAAAGAGGCQSELPPGPAYQGYDLDCVDVGHEVDVSAGDPHRLDGDDDGVGCEGW